METNSKEPALFVLQTFVDCFSKLSKPIHSIRKTLNDGFFYVPIQIVFCLKNKRVTQRLGVDSSLFVGRRPKIKRICQVDTGYIILNVPFMIQSEETIPSGRSGDAL
jgi:hypothetical protein